MNQNSAFHGIILLNICTCCGGKFKPTNSMIYETLCDLCQGEKQNVVGNASNEHADDHKINPLIEYGENKIKQIHRRILENEVKLESMESHSDYDYKDLLKESNEAEKEHKKDLKLFVDLLCKYKITIR